ncbi:MAG TPA: transcription repressor NadR [Epulopiscium sp.]|nr:transcription repressor NadR [Candidatus Epulonipiscium sp.]
MDGDQRREALIEMLTDTLEPLSGRRLGDIFEVSRQVIVQDIALIRAQGLDIIATARGYLLYRDAAKNKQRIFLVRHQYDDISDELNTMIDCGGIIRNVLIDHPIYGEMVGNMMLKTRRDVERFVEDILEFDTYPLMNLTHGVHMHTVEAANEEILDEIEIALNKKGYLYTEV